MYINFKKNKKRGLISKFFGFLFSIIGEIIKKVAIYLVIILILYIILIKTVTTL